MTNEIQVIDHTQPAQIAVAGQFNPSREQIDLLKRTIAKGTTDDEFSLFINTAKRLGLDPFARQIYAVKRNDNSDEGGGNKQMTIQVGIDGFRAIAERSGTYAPGRSTTYEYDKSDSLFSATAYGKKLVAGEWHEVSATAHFVEYAQKKRGGGLNTMWATKGHVMLGKCAEALMLRRGWPSLLAGVYTPDEIGEEQAPKQVAPKKAPTVAEVIAFISGCSDADVIRRACENSKQYKFTDGDYVRIGEAADERMTQLLETKAEELEAEVAQ